MSLVPGDPASLSACAATTAAVATRLSRLAEELTPALEQLSEGWSGRASVGPRRRAEALTDGAGTTAAELERVARLLQDQATDLADVTARARAVQERATAAGLEVRDGRVVPALGVLRAADADADRLRTARSADLQAELDLVLAQHRRRRDFVLDALRTSGDRLSTVSHGLRRG